MVLLNESTVVILLVILFEYVTREIQMMFKKNLIQGYSTGAVDRARLSPLRPDFCIPGVKEC